MLDRVAERDFRPDASGHRSKVPRFRLRAKLREVEPGRDEERRCGTVGNPPPNAERSRQLGIPWQHALLLCPRSDDGVPWIARALGRMDDERTRRPTTFSLLELVGPAPVVRHRATAEQIRFIPRRRGVINQDQQHLSTDVGGLEVIPLVLGSGGSIADEDQFSAGSARLNGRPRPYHHVLGITQRRRRSGSDIFGRGPHASLTGPRARPAIASHHTYRSLVSRNDVDRHLLEVRPVHSRLDTEYPQLRGDVFRREPAAARCGRTTFEKVGRQKAKVPVDLIRRDRRWRGGGLCKRRHRCEAERKKNRDACHDAIGVRGRLSVAWRVDTR
jgi:hypothetical protein